MARPHEREEERVVRLFVSSTFRDMRAERERLAKFVFPQVRKLCEARGVEFIDVDLRWGVSDEQKAEGKVLPICLEEIERSRPFFIGLLGERYGWIPGQLPRELLERETWLAEHAGSSVTELEMLHGVLNNPAVARRACFYFRDPHYLEEVPPERRSDFQPESDTAKQRLCRLKERIRQSGLACRENYPDPSTLGEWVLADLSEAIQEMFPLQPTLDPLARQAKEQEAFARSRRDIYLGGEEYFRRLDRHAAGSSPAMVVVGEPGSGKSALLANWVARRRIEHSEELLIAHFVGASATSTDWAGMLGRILGELKRGLAISLDIPNDVEQLRAVFANALHMASARRRVLLVIDALNQLEDVQGALDLLWLPPVIPANVCLVLSTLPGRAEEEARRRNWERLEVGPLQLSEKRMLVNQCLQKHRKTLAKDLAERLAAAEQSANPLYLRALLEELRLYGSHETLGARAEHFLKARTVSELYQRILVRWEDDYEGESDLVGDAMSLIWASKRGLSEWELLAMLGQNGVPLPRAVWSPLLLAAGNSLVQRSGLLGFFHDALREAVREAYLPTEAHELAAHLRLADFFEARQLGPRKVDELPWQLMKAQAWQRLRDVLTDPAFFEAAWDLDARAVKAYWTRIEANSSWRAHEAYRGVELREPGDVRRLENVAELLQYTRHFEEARELRTQLVEHFRSTGEAPKLAAALGNLARIADALDDSDAAFALHEEVDRISRSVNDYTSLAMSLFYRSVALQRRHDWDGAMGLSLEAEQICRAHGDKHGLARALANQAMVLQFRRDFDGAERLYRESESITRESGDLDWLQALLMSQADLCHERGDDDGALVRFREQERIFRDLGNADGIAAALFSQAAILWKQGRLDTALGLLVEKEKLCREARMPGGLARALDLHGTILRSRGDFDAAMRLYREAEEIYRFLGSDHARAGILAGEAEILHKLGDSRGALALYREAEQIHRDVGDWQVVQLLLQNQAGVLYDACDLEESERTYSEAVRICRHLGQPESLAGALMCQGLVSLKRSRSMDARRLLEDAYHVAKEHGLVVMADQISRLLEDAGFGRAPPP